MESFCFEKRKLFKMHSSGQRENVNFTKRLLKKGSFSLRIRPCEHTSRTQTFVNCGFLRKIFAKKALLRNRIDEGRVVESFHPHNDISPLLLTFFSCSGRSLLIPYFLKHVHDVDNSFVIFFMLFLESLCPRATNLFQMT